MPRIFRQPWWRATIAGTASLCLLMVPTAPAFAATLAVPSPGTALAGLKPAVQFRAEGVRYDTALRAISAIGTTPISTAQELQAAAAQLRRYAPDLRYATSRLVALAQADRTFTAAVARYFVNETFAKEFARGIAKDHTIVLRLDGAAALMKRMTELMNTNAAAIRKAEANLQAAIARLAGKAQRETQGAMTAITAASWAVVVNAVIIAAAVTFPAAAAGATVAGSIITVAAIAAFTAILPTLVYSGFPQGVAVTLAAFKQAAIDTAAANAQADADAIAACVDNALEKHQQCRADAAKLPYEERIPAELTCDYYLAAEQAFCSAVGVL